MAHDLRSSVIQGSFPHGFPAGHGLAFAPPAALALSGRSGGQPLPPVIQRRMETLFATRFDEVRVHQGREAASIGAAAFTHGSDIYFAFGQYNPTVFHGQRLLAHELTHVVQQRTGRVRNPLGAGVAVVHDPRMEIEAERMAQRAVMPEPPIQAKMAVRPATPARRSSVIQRNGFLESTPPPDEVREARTQVARYTARADESVFVKLFLEGNAASGKLRLKGSRARPRRSELANWVGEQIEVMYEFGRPEVETVYRYRGILEYQRRSWSLSDITGASGNVYVLEIKAMEVDPRRHSLGDILIDYLCRLAAAHGILYIVAGNITDTSRIGFYHKLGFRDVLPWQTRLRSWDINPNSKEYYAAVRSRLARVQEKMRALASPSASAAASASARVDFGTLPDQQREIMEFMSGYMFAKVSDLGGAARERWRATWKVD